MKYSIDTSALINLWRLPKDIFKSLWKDFEELCDNHTIISSDQVLEELDVREGDELCAWCKGKNNFEYPLDEDLQNALTNVNDRCNLVDHENHKSEGDPFVVALAFVKSINVISDERPRKAKSARMKIPDACDEMGIKHYSLYDFIREEGWSY